MVEPIWNKIDKFSQIDNSLLMRLTAPFWNIGGWRKFVMANVIVGMFFWIVLGWDSTIDQIIPISLKIGSPAFTFAFFDFIQNKVPWSYVVEQTASCYGLGTHWSAVVIYGLAFVTISKYYEKLEIKKSLNLMLSLMFTMFSIGIYEYSWMFSYSTFQSQSWVIGFGHTPFLMNALFLTAGAIGITFVLASPYKFNLNKKALVLVAFTIIAWFTWIYYPFPVQSLSVPLATGEIWTNTANFPQTMYTIDVFINDELYAGYPFFVQDDLVHLINTLTKVLLTTTVFYMVKLIPKKKVLT